MEVEGTYTPIVPGGFGTGGPAPGTSVPTTTDSAAASNVASGNDAKRIVLSTSTPASTVLPHGEGGLDSPLELGASAMISTEDAAATAPQARSVTAPKEPAAQVEASSDGATSGVEPASASAPAPADGAPSDDGIGRSALRGGRGKGLTLSAMSGNRARANSMPSISASSSYDSEEPLSPKSPGPGSPRGRKKGTTMGLGPVRKVRGHCTRVGAWVRGCVGAGSVWLPQHTPVALSLLTPPHCDPSVPCGARLAGGSAADHAVEPSKFEASLLEASLAPPLRGRLDPRAGKAQGIFIFRLKYPPPHCYDHHYAHLSITYLPPICSPTQPPTPSACPARQRLLFYPSQHGALNGTLPNRLL